MLKITSLTYFDYYVKHGLKPIAIHKGSKRPVGKEWNLNWSSERWRSYFQNDDYNMGIILGDIVDVEGDNPEACELLESMIKGYDRPKFSSLKSVHNLFINPDPSLTRTVINGIEFRGNLHQSVVPPSIHEDGCRYAFLAGTMWPIPPMPDKLRDFYFLNAKKQKKYSSNVKRIKKGFTKTICKVCNSSFYISKKRLLLEVKSFQLHDLCWMCHGCRKIDVKDDCRMIRKNMSRN